MSTKTEEFLGSLVLALGALGILAVFTGGLLAIAIVDVKYLIGVSLPGAIFWYLSLKIHESWP